MGKQELPLAAEETRGVDEPRACLAAIADSTDDAIIGVSPDAIVQSSASPPFVEAKSTAIRLPLALDRARSPSRVFVASSCSTRSSTNRPRITPRR